MQRLGMDSSFVDRYLNEGFSGGEKKRNEIMQMAILEPELAILDETDSGLDIDALRIVAKGIREVRADRPEMGVVLITHYQRLLDELAPDHVHILIDGRIVDVRRDGDRRDASSATATRRSGGRRRRRDDASASTTRPALDVAAVKAQFPLLRREIDGAPIALPRLGQHVAEAAVASSTR